MPLTVLTQRNVVAYFFKRSAIFDGNRPLRPSALGGLGATYDDHLRLIGKRVVNFLLVLIELFFARCYG